MLNHICTTTKPNINKTSATCKPSKPHCFGNIKKTQAKWKATEPKVDKAATTCKQANSKVDNDVTKKKQASG